ncbi:MAG: SDR family NAD(P)-dependent oxidoreductase [Clostridiales bacterium]|jgi:short-subunit dehydrogenase|nr:SDR family NAD(P)-dependent oxidoreductase [Clostridiales bacterium]
MENKYSNQTDTESIKDPASLDSSYDAYNAPDIIRQYKASDGGAVYNFPESKECSEKSATAYNNPEDSGTVFEPDADDNTQRLVRSEDRTLPRDNFYNPALSADDDSDAVAYNADSDSAAVFDSGSSATAGQFDSTRQNQVTEYPTNNPSLGGIDPQKTSVQNDTDAALRSTITASQNGGIDPQKTSVQNDTDAAFHSATADAQYGGIDTSKSQASDDAIDLSATAFKSEAEDTTVTGEKPQKVVFMIGASDGIGEKTAALLLKNGYKVYNGSRTECGITGVVNITLDAANPDSVVCAVTDIVSRETRIDALIYCAGFSLAAPLEKTLDADYRYLFEVNFFGFAKAAQSVLPHMRSAGGGRILAVGSMGGIYPIAFDAFYSASKAALNMLIRSLAIEVEPYNIRLTSILPGGTATGFTRKRKVYPAETTGVYEQQLMKANAALAEMEQNGMPPQKVAETILEALRNPTPALSLPVGIKNKALAAADKILPETVSNKIVKSRYRL